MRTHVLNLPGQQLWHSYAHLWNFPYLGQEDVARSVGAVRNGGSTVR